MDGWTGRQGGRRAMWLAGVSGSGWTASEGRGRGNRGAGVGAGEQEQEQECL
jgi:hypothetical protein